YRCGGRLLRYTIGTTDQWDLADARDRAGEAIRAAAKGVNMAAEKKAERKAETFGDLAKQYMERYAKKHKKSWPEDQRIIDTYLNKQFENVKAKNVARAEIRTMLEKIGKVAPIMSNRVLACVRKIFNWAIGNDVAGITTNPCLQIQRPG